MTSHFMQPKMLNGSFFVTSGTATYLCIQTAVFAFTRFIYASYADDDDADGSYALTSSDSASP